ncbi:hypothetical protein ACFSM5_20595 [Lacibacterium aquatile]|uniref:DUF433 domain-containing protein n=1 Tax=Lacibacterium aquatile TaxID=1168082 RepID=A0ABW5E1H1_9PROT
MAQVFLGVGLYSVNQAAQLLKREPSRLRRWLVGRRYRAADGSEKWSAPLLSSQIGIIDGQLVLSFRDLMELRALDRFLAAGLSVRLLRKAMVMAREAFQDGRPLSNRRFGTDGRTLFAGGDGMMLDLVSGQYAPVPLIAPSLASDCEFDAASMPLRWWPLGRASGIVLDPGRAFGQPLLDRLGVPVSVLTAAAGDCFGATPDELHAARDFETWLAA